MNGRAHSPSPQPGDELSQAAFECAGLRWVDGALSPVREQVVVEEPLCVEIAYERLGQEVSRVLSVTMRTPGDDEDLALGFLYCEGLIDKADDTLGGELRGENSRGEKIPTWRVRLAHPPRNQEIERISRGIITSAACGLCGRTSLKGLRAAAIREPADAGPVSGMEILALPGKLRDLQVTYPETGGCHGAGLFSESGAPLVVREDVGRHNAVDKVVGAALRGAITTSGRTLVLSGRAGFELVQKAAAAGVSLVVAVGAPSSFAVALARDSGVTLVGFARDGRFNLYSHSGRPVRG